MHVLACLHEDDPELLVALQTAEAAAPTANRKLEQAAIKTLQLCSSAAKACSAAAGVRHVREQVSAPWARAARGPC